MAIIHCDFYSNVLEEDTSMVVILPQQKRADRQPAENYPGGKYPVLFLLHGLSDNHTTWLRRTSIERYVEPLGLAVVMPSVGRSYYTDMALGLKYGTFMGEELPSIARSLFPLSREREGTFLAGLSMGGYGAMKLALTHPEQYAAAASLSGVLDIVDAVKRGEAANPKEAHLIFGNLRRLAGSRNDLFYLAKQVANSKGPKPLLYACCGTDDEYYLDNIRFRDIVNSLDLSLTYEEGPGKHEWEYWDRQIQRVLAWLPITG